MHFLKSHRSTLLTFFSVLAAAFAAPYLVPGDPDAQVFRNGVLPALLLLAALWGGSSIWFAPLCSELLCFAMALILMRRFRRDTTA